LGVLALFVKEMRIWREIEGLIEHCISKVQIFILVNETGGFVITAIVCGGYGGIDLNNDCDNG
jgi:hypothetical protein